MSDGNFTLEHWDSAAYDRLRRSLHDLEDEGYRAFHSRLITSRYPLRGVRLPNLRRIAGEIAKGNWREYLACCQTDTYEEVMLHGMVLGATRGDFEEILSRMAEFIPLIDNWAICDSTCMAFKLAKKHRERTWEFLRPYLASTEEFELRFAVVMLLDHFVTEEDIDRVLEFLGGIRHEGYYVKMAVAWAVSVCYVKFPERTMALLQSGCLDLFTHNKAIQKCVESYRVSDGDKQKLRAMKRK